MAVSTPKESSETPPSPQAATAAAMMMAKNWLALAALAAAVLLVGPAHAAGLPSCGTASAFVPSPTDLLGGICETYTAVHPDGSLSFCNGVVDYPFFLPPGQSQAQLDVLAEKALTKENPQAALLLGILPPKCQVQLKKTVCLSVFQACEYVDPYWADVSCPTPCVPCGDVNEVLAENILNEDNLGPGYGSLCGAEPAMCIAGPGKVPGLGNIGWELARTLQASSLSMDEYCSGKGLRWSEESKSCLVAIPRSPCKGECDKLWSMNRTVDIVDGGLGFVESVCPLISGNFDLLLNNWKNNSNDDYVREQAEDALLGSTGGRSTVSLLAAFQLAPDCNDVNPANPSVYTFSKEYILESASDRNVGVGALIAGKALQFATLIGDKCHCVNDLAILNPTLVENTNEHCNAGLGSTYCTHLMTKTAVCNSESGAELPAPSLRFVGVNEGDMNPVCKQVVTAPENQPGNETLDFIKLVFGLPSREAAAGAFYVPPTPGLPVLATGEMERPLCAVPNNVPTGEVFTGKDAYTCTLATVKSAAGVVPPILKGKCRAAYLDLLCNTAHMKVEMKSMCLVPPGNACASDPLSGAAENRIPFIFGLPRFPSKFLCTNFKTECAGYLAQLDPMQKSTIDAAFNCDGEILQTCARNNPINPWSGAWNCSSPLNGQPSYPESFQALSDIDALLYPYGALNSMTAYLQTLGVSKVTNATISSDTSKLGPLDLCECPYPLVVPEDPNAPTENGLCCSVRCQGNMYTDEESESIILVQIIVSVLSMVGTFFIIITWSTFKVKRSQASTLRFAVVSFIISLAFLVPVFSHKEDLQEVWCRDNTQPNTQEDGGMCLYQSIFLSYFVLCACCIWLTQGIDLFLRIVRNQRHLDHMNKYYHLFIWGYPLIVVSTILGTQQAGYETTFFWCFMRDAPENPTLNKAIDLGMFYGSIIAIWFFGALIMAAVLYRIYEITSRTKGTAQVSNTTLKRLTVYRTPIFFVLFFVYIWASIFGWRFDAEVRAPKIKESAADWVACLLTNFVVGIEDPATDPRANSSLLVEKWGIANASGCGEVFPHRIAYSNYIYLMCITGLQGVFVFLIFGAKVENINLWKEKFGLTTKKYDTTAEDSSTKERTAKGTVLSNVMSNIFSGHSPQIKENESVEKEGGGSAVMVNGLQSGKFIAVTEGVESPGKIRNNQVAAAYMSDE